MLKAKLLWRCTRQSLTRRQDWTYATVQPLPTILLRVAPGLSACELFFLASPSLSDLWVTMPLYDKIPDTLQEVDVIIAGGWYSLLVSSSYILATDFSLQAERLAALSPHD